MAVADILPPNDKRRYSQTSPEAQKAYRNLETSRVSQSRIKQSASPASNGGTLRGNAQVSKYRQLRDELRSARRGEQNGPRLTQNQRRYTLPSQIGSSSKPESKLSTTTVFFMVTVAIALDIAEIVLDLIVIGVVINPILDILVFIGFWIWLKMKGVNLISAKTGAKKAIAFFGVEAFDLLLVGGDLPLWTLDIVLVILFQKAEEKLSNSSPIVKEVVSKGASHV